MMVSKFYFLSLILIIFINYNNAFNSKKSRLVNTVQRQTSSRLNAAAISPRKQLFFDIVRSGLSDRFPEDEDNINSININRIWNFCKYATNEMSLPLSMKEYHDYCEEYIDDLEAKPFWDKSSFSWVEALEETSSIIAVELNDLLEKEKEQMMFKQDSKYASTMGLGWQAIRLQRMGEWNEENMIKFPKTSRIIQGLNIPLAVRGVMFAKQNSRTGVKPHSDGRNFILTAHLGLRIPQDSKNCYIKVGTEQKEWKQNEVLIFDTSFVHETSNDTDEDRYVLIIDFWHPQLTEAEKTALEFIYDSRNKFENGQVKSIECSYVASGQPTDIDLYIKKKRSLGRSFLDFFSDGGLVKFNPLQK